MSKAESGFSTDDNGESSLISINNQKIIYEPNNQLTELSLEEATPVGAEVEEPPKVVRRTRKKAPAEDLSKAEPVENFSDDE